MTNASLDNSGNLVCEYCNEEIEICTDQCGTNSCGEEWVHSKTKKHECEDCVLGKTEVEAFKRGKLATLKEVFEIINNPSTDETDKLIELRNLCQK